MPMAERVVVIGAGHAGFQLAIQLRQNGFDGTIDLINGEPDLPYERPPLSKGFVTGALDSDALAFRPEAFFSEQRINLIQSRATAIDRGGRSVQLANGAVLPYDHLVLATGAGNRLLSVPGVAGEGVCYLRTLAEANHLRNRLQGEGRIVVIGAGFIGLEFAATARKAGHAVTVLERADRAMARAVSPAISGYFDRRHREAGISIHYDVEVAEVLRSGAALTGVRSRTGEDFAADLVVVGIGVVPETALAVAAALAVDGGIVVDAMLQTADPAISAIGDCAAYPSVHSEGRVRLESVQNAVDHARCVAARLMGQAQPYSALPWFWSDQGADKLQIVGLTAGADNHVLRGDPHSGSFSVFCYRSGRLIGIESVNRAGDHVLGRKLLAAGGSVPAEIAADETINLKQFLA